MGITEKMYRDILRLNVDVVTMGNHTWGKKDIFGFIDEKTIVRPANYPANNPGNGYTIIEKKGKKIAVINLIGRVTMGVLSENPFLIAKEMIQIIKSQVDIIIVDFHAEATAEKIALRLLFRWRGYHCFWHTYPCANSRRKNFEEWNCLYFRYWNDGSKKFRDWHGY